MIQPLLIDRGSRGLAEQIAGRIKNDVPVVIEMTASRRGSSLERNHVDAINFFEGVIERLDRTLPRGWRRPPTWSELDRGTKREYARQRLYLYAQARVGLAQMHRIDAVAHDLAESMNVHYGLAMAPGIALSSLQIRRDGVGGARDALFALVADDPAIDSVPGSCSVRARWVIAGRPGGVTDVASGRESPGTSDRRSPRARLYLTLLRRRWISRRASPRTPLDAGGPAMIPERRALRGPTARRVAGHADPD